MQRSLVVNAGMPETPEPDCGVDLELPPHDTPPPVEVAEPPDHLPGQIQAPTDVGKPLNSLQGETSLRMMVDEPDIGAHTRGHDAHRRGAWPSSLSRLTSPTFTTFPSLSRFGSGCHDSPPPPFLFLFPRLAMRLRPVWNRYDSL